jgi:hypothetical protein
VAKKFLPPPTKVGVLRTKALRTDDVSTKALDPTMTMLGEESQPPLKCINRGAAEFSSASKLKFSWFVVAQWGQPEKRAKDLAHYARQSKRHSNSHVPISPTPLYFVISTFESRSLTYSDRNDSVGRASAAFKDCKITVIMATVSVHKLVIIKIIQESSI